MLHKTMSKCIRRLCRFNTLGARGHFVAAQISCRLRRRATFCTVSQTSERVYLCANQCNERNNNIKMLGPFSLSCMRGHKQTCVTQTGIKSRSVIWLLQFDSFIRTLLLTLWKRRCQPAFQPAGHPRFV